MPNDTAPVDSSPDDGRAIDTRLVRKLAGILKDTDLTEIEVERGDLRIRVAREVTVAEGQTLLIVEAMKTMNPISSPRAGKIVEILVADAQPVEFGEPLVVIE